jgi:hypothetical protein
MSRGAITSCIPVIYKLNFANIDHWGSAEFEGYSTLMSLFEWQFYTFFSGLVILLILIAVLLLRNREII